MSDQYAYRLDQELPAMAIAWDDGAGNLLALAAGWTASVKVALATAPTATLLLKTTGITLADTSPNYVIDWTITDFTTLAAAAAPLGAGKLFVVHAYARRNTDTKDRCFRPDELPTFKLLPAAS